MALSFFVAVAPIGVLGLPTPWGHRSANCVVEVPEGSTIIEAEGGGTALRHLSGAIELVHVPEECRQDDVIKRLSARQTARKEMKAGVTTDGWLDNVAYTYNAGYTKFTGSFNVPANPPKPQKPETLYYFPGMENLGGPVNILQPVLTWGDESEDAVGGWSVWSWACCPSDITFNSKNVGGLEEGMIIDGVMEKNGNTWRIDTAFTDKSGQRQNTTLLADLGRYTYNWADVTLEVYNLTNCDQHSPTEVKFTDLKLYGSSGQITPQWSGATTSSCGGRVTVHDPATISIKHQTATPVPPPTPSPSPKPSPAPAPTPGCVDVDAASDCSSWSQQGYCSSSSQYYSYMKEHCCHTCGFGGVVEV